ncbi:MAG TPA: hypothetical protein VI357_26605 [Mycobacteriales bacterium]
MRRTIIPALVAVGAPVPAVLVAGAGSAGADGGSTLFLRSAVEHPDGAQKSANAAGSAAVQRVTVRTGVAGFPSTVDFDPTRVVEAPDGFPPNRRRSGRAVVL